LNTITKNGSRPQLAPDVDLEQLAMNCDGYSGADLKALVTKAAEVAFSEDIAANEKAKVKVKAEVNKRHFEAALTAIRTSVQGSDKRRYDKMKLKLQPQTASEAVRDPVPEAAGDVIMAEEPEVPKMPEAENIMEKEAATASAEVVKEAVEAAKETVTTKEAESSSMMDSKPASPLVPPACDSASDSIPTEAVMEAEAVVEDDTISSSKEELPGRYYNTERRQLKFNMAQGRKFGTF
jgi:hypothetical protein